MVSSERGASPLRAAPQPVPKLGKSEQTRAKILNAALDFLWLQPFRDMTVSSLMDRTGVSRSAFYRYFTDLHDVMTTLLDMVQEEILVAAEPWIAGVGDPVALMHETMAGLVRVCYERGPFIRAISDAAATDDRFATAWSAFLGRFDDAAGARIHADQQQGLVADFDVPPVAFALNRLDASTLIDAFGQHPRSEPEPIREALAHIWIATLYGNQWLASRSSTLNRAR
jgi:AcrR family transcriptional regulator